MENTLTRACCLTGQGLTTVMMRAGPPPRRPAGAPASAWLRRAGPARNLTNFHLRTDDTNLKTYNLKFETPIRRNKFSPCR